ELGLDLGEQTLNTTAALVCARIEKGRSPTPGRGWLHRARDRGHHRPREPCGACPLHQGRRPASTGRGCHGQNSNICSQTCRNVCQKGRKSLENQGPKMTDPTRTAPVKANQRLTVANPRPRRHWAAKVISATGKPGRGRGQLCISCTDAL